MLISFVIPVYKVEKYLKECVDSILKQSFSDYEIILVDDGSPDNSGVICDEYAAKYDFISVIHKQNGGLSDARNAGIKQAQGDYILFVDSDDYIGEESLTAIAECVWSQSQIIDVVFLDAYKVFPDKKIIPLGDGYISNEINGKTKASVMKHLATLPKYPGSACTKLIRTDLIIQNNLFFERGLLSEDIDWTVNLLMKAKGFAYCTVKYYYYRQDRDGSITNTVGLKNIMDLLYIISKWASKNERQEYQKEINAFMAYEYMITLYNYGHLTKSEQEKVKDKVKDNRWLLKYGGSKRVRLISLFCKLFGVQTTSYMLKKIH